MYLINELLAAVLFFTLLGMLALLKIKFSDRAVIDVNPKTGYVIESENYTDNPLMFNCSVALDVKTAVANGRPKIYWKTDLAELQNEIITESRDTYGVKVSDFSLSVLEHSIYHPR